MKRLFVLSILLWVSLSVPLTSGQAQTGNIHPYDTWTVSFMRDIGLEMSTALATALPQYAAEDDPLWAAVDWDTLLLSPAGDVIIGMGFADDHDPDTDGNLVCRYVIATSTMTCAPLEPREARFAPTPIQAAWSPDGTQIALHEDAFQRMLDSDLWVLDGEKLTVSNRTDDGLYGKWQNARGKPYTLDIMPIWTPNGDLYFFRLVNGSEGRQWAVFRLPQAQGEPEHVLDMPAPMDEFDLSWRSLVALSPAGTQLVVAPRSFGYPFTRGLWLIDLAVLTVEEFVAGIDLQVGFPDWLDPAAGFADGSGLVPQRVMWSSDGQTVIVYGTPYYPGDEIPGTINFLTVDTTTRTVAPLIDYSLYADEAAVRADRSLFPGMGWLAPDGGTLFYLPQSESEDLALYAVPVTLDAEPVVVQALTPEQYEALTSQNRLDRNGYMAQMGANGNVLCGATLFMLE